MKHVLNAIATPRANGQVERQNRTILDALATSAGDELSWDDGLPEIIWGMNNTVNASTGMSPSQLMFTHSKGALADLSRGVRETNKPVGEASFTSDQEHLIGRRKRAKANLDRAGEAMRAQYDKRRKVATQYQVNDLVLWRNASTVVSGRGVNRKLTNKYDGPYRISRVMGNDRYVIVSLKGMRGYKRFSATVAADSLRRYVSSARGEAGTSGDVNADISVDVDGDGDYE